MIIFFDARYAGEFIFKLAFFLFANQDALSFSDKYSTSLSDSPF